MSSRGDEDLSHQGVTEAAKNDSMIGAPRSERTKDDGVVETTVSNTPDRSVLSLDNTQGTTAGHAVEGGLDQVETEGHFENSGIGVGLM